MPSISTPEAVEKLVKIVEKAKPSLLPHYYDELFPAKPTPANLTNNDLVRFIRGGLAAEEIVDLWNVVIPDDRQVHYDAETRKIHFNEVMAGYEE